MFAKEDAFTAPVLAMDIDVTGNYMVTSGLDGQCNVWDVRTYKKLHSYFTVRPASTLSLSHMGQLALGFGPHVQVWKDALGSKAKEPYMREMIPGQVCVVSSWIEFQHISTMKPNFSPEMRVFCSRGNKPPRRCAT